MAEFFLVQLLPTYISAVAGILVGLYCLLRAKAPGNLLLGGWLMAHGLSYAADAMTAVAPSLAFFVAGMQTSFALSIISSLLAIWFILWFIESSPQLLWGAAGFTVFTLAMLLWRLVDLDRFMEVVPPDQADPYFGTTGVAGYAQIYGMELVFLTTGLVMSAAVLMLVARHARSQGQERRSLMLLALLLTSGNLYFSLDSLIFRAITWDQAAAHFGLAILITETVAVTILLAAAVTTFLWTMRSDQWEAKGRAFLLAGLVFLAIATGAFLPNGSDLLIFVFGLFGLLYPFGIAFAALRGQMPGLDGKARITIRSGTLAAIFLAVGFVVSEAAAEFFGQTSGNQYWGILAAGLLMFAIAPLQRLSTRLADATVPVTVGSGQDAGNAFEQLVRMAWVDGRISHAERKELEAARVRLGLDEAAAYQIQQRVLD